MKKKIILLMVILSLLTINSLASAGKLYSVEINNVEKKQAIDYMVNELINNGFSIIAAGDYQVSVRKDIDDLMLRVLYGSKFNTTPEVRLSLNFGQVDKNVRISTEARIVTNPNSGWENSQIIENKEIQRMLENCKISLEQKYTHAKENESIINITGFTVSDIRTDTRYLNIQNVLPDGNAFKAGLRKGDLITKINGMSVINMNNFDLATFMKFQKENEITLNVKSSGNVEDTVMTFEKTIK